MEVKKYILMKLDVVNKERDFLDSRFPTLEEEDRINYLSGSKKAFEDVLKFLGDIK